MSEAAPVGGAELSSRVGELRRLTIMFCDVVGSTELSGRWEPETYRELMSRLPLRVPRGHRIRFDGHIVQIKGDGILAVFGFPVAHENDAERAVRAGLALVRAVNEIRPARRGCSTSRSRFASPSTTVRCTSTSTRTTSTACRERRRSAAGHRRAGHRRRVGRGPQAGRRIASRSRPAIPRSSKASQDPLQPFRVIGERRVPVQRGLGDAAGRARCRARAPPAGLGARFGRRRPSASAEC